MDAPCAQGPSRARSHRARSGFTLLEVLMVTVLIAILIVVAVPLLRRSQMAGNEVAAMKGLRTLHTTQIQYQIMYKQYGRLENLGPPPAGKNFLDDKALASGQRSGYVFSIEYDPAAAPSLWHGIATPQAYGTTGARTFYIDETGVVRGQDLGSAQTPTRAVAELWPVVE